MAKPKIVPRDQWTKARIALLAREKELTRLRDAVARERRELPWVKIDADYRFDGPDGEQTLSDLFAGRGQLLVYHFMFDPAWNEACKSCSFWAESFDGAQVHINQRDTTMVAVSRAPLAKLEAFKRRMGWRFKWLSSGRSTFNRDFHVSFTAADRAAGATYNYAPAAGEMSELPGLSVFAKDDKGAVYHTYSCYARGLDALNPTYQLLDLTPKGRDEDGLPFTMAWVRLKDQYQAA